MRTRGAVSFSFDDARAEHVEAGRLLEEFGYRGTFYIVPGLLKEAAAITTKLWWRGIPVRLMGWRDVRYLLRKGHEIGNHSMTHRKAYPPMTPEERQREVVESGNLIEAKTGVRPKTWAWPHYRDEPVAGRLAIAQGMRHRPAGPRLSYNCGKGRKPMPLERMDRWIEKAVGADRWVHVIVHAFQVGDKPVSAGRFRKHLKVVRATGIEVLTVQEGLAKYA